MHPRRTPRPLLEELVPAQVAAAEAFEDDGAAPLPEERDLVARAVEPRRREFATTRACARTALGRLGVDPVPIPRGPGGAPRWPTGLVGSLTHCAGYRAAAVARAADVETIGVDAEPNKALPDGVLPVVALRAERAALAVLATHRRDVAWDRLLFSAKECVYKAWFPLARRWLDFGDVLVTLDPQTTTFRARVTDAPRARPRAFTGRWLVRDGLIVTAIASPRDHRAAHGDPTFRR